MGSHGAQAGEVEAAGLMRAWGAGRGAGSSAGGLVDLLAGGDDLAVLHLFHNRAHLTGGHGCRRQTLRGGQGPREPGSAPPCEEPLFPPQPRRPRLCCSSASPPHVSLCPHCSLPSSLSRCWRPGPPRGWGDSDPRVLSARAAPHRRGAHHMGSNSISLQSPGHGLCSCLPHQPGLGSPRAGPQHLHQARVLCSPSDWDLEDKDPAPFSHQARARVGAAFTHLQGLRAKVMRPCPCLPIRGRSPELGPCFPHHTRTPGLRTISQPCPHWARQCLPV